MGVLTQEKCVGRWGVKSDGDTQILLPKEALRACGIDPADHNRFQYGYEVFTPEDSSDRILRLIAVEPKRCRRTGIVILQDKPGKYFEIELQGGYPKCEPFGAVSVAVEVLENGCIIVTAPKGWKRKAGPYKEFTHPKRDAAKDEAAPTNDPMPQIFALHYILISEGVEEDRAKRIVARYFEVKI